MDYLRQLKQVDRSVAVLRMCGDGVPGKYDLVSVPLPALAKFPLCTVGSTIDRMHSCATHHANSMMPLCSHASSLTTPDPVVFPRAVECVSMALMCDRGVPVDANERDAVRPKDTCDYRRTYCSTSSPFSILQRQCIRTS